MLNNIYLKIKKFMKENYKSIIILLICYFVFTFPLPYYIYAGGGTINIDDRLSIANTKASEGTLNFAYVKELKGNVATFILGNIIPFYDVEKQEDVSLDEDETSEDIMFRNRIYLENANQTAIMLAYQKAGKEVSISDKHFYVIYVEDKEDNGLRVGDELLKVNGKEILDINDYTKEIQKYNIGDEVKVTVKRNDQEKEVSATVKKGEDGNKLTGISVSTIYEYKTDPKIELNFKDSEGGPSGGLMLTLAIYDRLTDDDLTNGLKIVGTGTISSDGTVGEIGGVKYKLNGAVKAKADLFLVPKGDNYKEALKEKEKNDYDIEIKAIGTFDEAVSYLESLKS